VSEIHTNRTWSSGVGVEEEDVYRGGRKSSVCCRVVHARSGSEEDEEGRKRES
jgi:hypothetical protein